jgi:predicted dehydrogenase
LPDTVYCAVNEAETASVDETAILTLTYGSTTATIDVSWRVPAFGKRRELLVAGSEATGFVDSQGHGREDLREHDGS